MSHFFVVISPNGANVPNAKVITAAMTAAGGSVTGITQPGTSARVDYTGDVVHSTFANALARAAGKKPTNWEFAWGDGSSDALVADPTGYQITITMPQSSLDSLVNENAFLYAFKAVQSEQPASGAPLVWFKLGAPGYSLDTVLNWQVQYQAYTSTNTIVPNGQVTASFNADIDLGQALHVTGVGGDGQVKDDGTPKALTIANDTTTPFTCGISAPAVTPAGPVSNPICAFPLYGESGDVFVPIEKVLLMFSTKEVDTGTVIEQSYSAGVLVDVTGGIPRTVNFDINGGWAWDGGRWAVSIPFNEQLVPLLIEPSSNVSAPAERLAS